MADSGSDGSPRPPTFVQIRPPATPARVKRRLGVLGVGLALVAAVGWMAHRPGGERDGSVTPAAPQVTAAAVPPAQPAPVDLHAELERRVIDRAAFAPLWTRESLIDQVAPFSPSSPEAAPSSAPLPVEAADATSDGAREVSVRLAKGET